MPRRDTAREERCDFLNDDCDGTVDETFNVGGACEVAKAPSAWDRSHSM